MCSCIRSLKCSRHIHTSQLGNSNPGGGDAGCILVVWEGLGLMYNVMPIGCVSVLHLLMHMRCIMVSENRRTRHTTSWRMAHSHTHVCVYMSIKQSTTFHARLARRHWHMKEGYECTPSTPAFVPPIWRCQQCDELLLQHDRPVAQFTRIPA